MSHPDVRGLFVALSVDEGRTINFAAIIIGKNYFQRRTSTDLIGDLGLFFF